MNDNRQMLLSSWLPPGGSCHDEISALRNRYFVVTDEGWRWLKVIDCPVKWWKLKHIPFIGLHSFTNLSPPLISLFCQSVPKCRLPKNPASPRGKPRGRRFTLLPFNARHPLSQPVRADSSPKGGAEGASRRMLANRFLSGIVTGEVREPTYSYRVRSVIVRRHCRRFTKNLHISYCEIYNAGLCLNYEEMA